MHRGYIKLYRKIEDDELWKIKPFSPVQAWIDLIKSANHKDKNVFFHQRIEPCQRGEYITSILKLSIKWGWSRTKTKNFLNTIQKVDKILYKTIDKRFIKITICKYEIYQGHDKIKEQENVQESRQEKSKRKTRERQEKDINNNDKNVNNVKNEKNDKKKKEVLLKNGNSIYSSDSIEIRLSTYFLSKIRENNPNFKEPNLQNWAHDINLMIRIDNRTPEQIEYLINWAQQDDFWSPNILCPAKLRKQFDALVAKVRVEHKKRNPTLEEKQPGIYAWLRKANQLKEERKND